MHDIADEWIKKYPEDASAHRAKGASYATLYMQGKLDLAEAIDLMDSKAKLIENLDALDIVTDGWFEVIFNNFYKDLKNGEL